MSNTNRGSAPILLVALVLIAGIAIGLLLPRLQNIKISYNPTSVPTVNSPAPTPTPSSFKGRKTFVNSKFGYTFQYPPEANLNRGPGNLSDEEIGKGRLVDIYFPLTYDRDPGTGFFIDTNQLDQNGNQRNCGDLSDCIAKSTTFYPENTTREETTFMGQKAVRLTYNRDTAIYSQTFSSLFVILNDDLYQFLNISEKTRYEEVKPTFDKILSTFKFTR